MKKIVKYFVPGFSIFLAATLFAGCSKKALYEAPAGFGAVANSSMKMSTKAVAREYSDSFVSADMAFEVEEEAALDSEVFERKLIRTGNLSLEVKALSDSEEMVTAWAKGFGGYITNANTWETSASFTVRIPAARFDEAMTQAGELGKILNRSVSSDDVSDRYYDLKSRLETKYILRDKLTSYLSSAKDMKDLLEIERQLSSVIEEIESKESQLKRLSGQIDYSTIYINMQYERGKDEGGIILPDVKDSWNKFVSNIISFFWGLVVFIFYAIVFGIPLVIVAAFLFWLLFGKVGILVKLFKKLKK